jgi:hypothetical protein
MSTMSQGDQRASNSRTVVALRRGHLTLLVGRAAELPTSLSSDPAFGKQAHRLYIESGGATTRNVSKSLDRLLLETEAESRHMSLQSRQAAKVQADRPVPYGWLVTCQNALQRAWAAPSR